VTIFIALAPSPTHIAEGESVERSTDTLVHVCFRSDRQLSSMYPRHEGVSDLKGARLAVGWLGDQCCQLAFFCSLSTLVKTYLAHCF
jgi:hypothetical protein